MTRTTERPNPEHESRTSADPQAVVSAVQHAIRRKTPTPVALHEPEFQGNEARYVGECIDTRWVSSLGSFVDQFEEMLCEFTGAKRAVATNSGTSALHICLLLAGVEPGDEVLIPTLTFVATANSVSYCHAIPHFVDSEDLTLGVDAERLDAHLSEIAEVRDGICVNTQSGRVIRAFVPMHVFGHPVDLDAAVTVAERWNIVLVEDAAESIGSFYRGKHTGRFGRIAAISFNGNKIVTTGGGGAIVTDDDEVGERAKHLVTTARIGRGGYKFTHDGVGYNYGMPNLNAALGCAQLEELPGFLARKRELASRYFEAFAGVGGARVIAEPPGCTSNYWLNALELPGATEHERDAVIDALNAAGLMARPVWTLMHELPMYEGCPRMALTVAERLGRTVFNVPSSPFLVD